MEETSENETSSGQLEDLPTEQADLVTEESVSTETDVNVAGTGGRTDEIDFSANVDLITLNSLVIRPPVVPSNSLVNIQSLDPNRASFDVIVILDENNPDNLNLISDAQDFPRGIDDVMGLARNMPELDSPPRKRLKVSTLRPGCLTYQSFGDTSSGDGMVGFSHASHVGEAFYNEPGSSAQEQFAQPGGSSQQFDLQQEAREIPEARRVQVPEETPRPTTLYPLINVLQGPKGDATDSEADSD